MKRSEQTNDLCKALAEAQAEMKNPGFDSTNPHFRNKFASLAAVRNAVVPVLAKHGISVLQELTTSEGGVGCLTVLNHASGQWMELGPLWMPSSKADAQGFGSASTYCKRYALQSVAGVVGDEDDDAEVSVQRATVSTLPPEPKIDTRKVNEYSDRIKKAISDDNDGLLVDLMSEVKEAGNDFRIAVWATLPSAVKNAIKDKAPRAA